MSSDVMVRWSGAACILAGLAIAAFVLIHPWDQLVGAEIAQTARWRAAHTLHFLGALFALPGLLGIYAADAPQLGKLGLLGLIVSLVGMAMFLGTGMITAFIWPMLAVHAPSTVDAGGPIFHMPVSATAFVITAATMICGHLLFGWALLRSGGFPRFAIVLLMIGAVLGMLPPHPLSAFPWGGLVLGGVLYGAAMAWLGIILWRGDAPART